MDKKNINIDGNIKNISVDINQLENIVCKSCGCSLWKQVFILKKVPYVLSPVGKDTVASVPTIVCNGCGSFLQEESANQDEASNEKMIVT